MLAADRILLMPLEQFECQQARALSREPQLWDLLEAVKDPEIPVLSIWELGVLRAVERDADTVTVTITPTYSGCPAMDMIAADIERVLREAGHVPRVKTQLAPAWSTTWMSPEGREKLSHYGIAPPGQAVPVCPHCNSEDVKLVSEFGSTACKALYTCSSCYEPFDFFKNL